MTILPYKAEKAVTVLWFAEQIVVSNFVVAPFGGNNIWLMAKFKHGGIIFAHLKLWVVVVRYNAGGHKLIIWVNSW